MIYLTKTKRMLEIRLVMALVFCLSLPTSSNAETAYEALTGMKFCKTLKDDSQRLKCFDSLGDRKHTIAGSKHTGWEIKEGRSPVDDTLEVEAVLLAEEGDGSLVLRCKEKRSEAILLPDPFFYLGNGRSIRVLARIGDGKPINTSWQSSSSGESAFAPSPIEFMQALPDGSKLFLRAFNYRGVPADNVFNLGSVSNVRRRVAEACNWQGAAKQSSASPTAEGETVAR
jgi:hypothetical protein